jgi:hypothetical protein
LLDVFFSFVPEKEHVFVVIGEEFVDEVFGQFLAAADEGNEVIFMLFCHVDEYPVGLFMDVLYRNTLKKYIDNQLFR